MPVAGLTLVLGGALAVGLVACGADRTTPDPKAPTAGLVILAGEPGAATLTIHDDGGGSRGVTLPHPGTAWIAAGPGGRLAATLDDGTVELSDKPATGVDPAWRPATGGGADLPAEPLRFATWSPGGARIAALAADFGAAARLTLTIIDPVAGATLLLPIPGEPVIAPLAWLSDERLLVQTDRGAIVVHSITGAVAAGPPIDAPGRTPVAISAGALIALADPAGGAVDIRPLVGWLAGDTAEPLARIEEQAEVGSMALTQAGDRLAIVWQQIEGPGTTVVYGRADGWREVARATLPGGSARAAVDWLR